MESLRGCLCRKSFEHKGYTGGGGVNLVSHSRFSFTASGVNLFYKLTPPPNCSYLFLLGILHLLCRDLYKVPVFFVLLQVFKVWNIVMFLLSCTYLRALKLQFHKHKSQLSNSPFEFESKAARSNNEASRISDME